MTEVTVETLQTRDGVSIALHRIGPRTGIPVLLIPGTFSNHTFWLGTRGVGLARTLAARGFEAIVLDPRGHGLSQRAGRADRWDFDHWIRQDVPAVLGAIGAEGRRPFVIGHSAGGATALACLGSHPELEGMVRGLVVVSTPVPWMQPWRGLAARAFRLASRKMGRFPARRLGLGPEDELGAVMAQWMTWNIEGHWTADDGSDYEAGMRRLRVPLLTLAGAGDWTFSPPAACRGLFDRIGSPEKTFHLCGRATGYAEDFNHVSILVGKGAQAETWPLIIEWLARAGES